MQLRIYLLGLLGLAISACTAPCCPGAAAPAALPSMAPTPTRPLSSMQPLPSLRGDGTSEAALKKGPHYHIEVRIARDSKTLSSASVAATPGTAVSLSAAKQLSFVQDINVEVQGEKYLADPIIGILQQGLSLELAAAPASDDSGRVWLAFRTTSAALAHPLRTFDVRVHAGGSPAKLQLPHLALQGSTGLRMPKAGKEVLLFSTATETGAKGVELLATVTAVGDVQSVNWSPAPTAAKPGRPTEEEGSLGIIHAPRDLITLLHEAASTTHSAHHPLKRMRLEFVSMKRALPRFIPVPAAEAQGRLGKEQHTVCALELSASTVAGISSEVVEQQSYIQDYDPAGPTTRITTQEGTRIKSDRDVYDPIIGTIKSGISATLLEDKGRLYLDLVWANTVKPIELFSTRLAPDLTVTIELPELRLQNARIDMESGEITTVVGGAEDIESHLDLTPGRTFLPLGKTIGADGHSLHGIGVWITIDQGS